MGFYIITLNTEAQRDKSRRDNKANCLLSPQTAAQLKVYQPQH